MRLYSYLVSSVVFIMPLDIQRWHEFRIDDSKSDSPIRVISGTNSENDGIVQQFEDLEISHSTTGYYQIRNRFYPEEYPASVAYSSTVEEIVIYQRPEMWKDFNLHFLISVALQCLFIHHSILSLHASCVELGGCAVCFTADSGVGKSTRARAWVDGLGAEFISGDRPAIRLEPDGSLACGVPWDGKEQIFRNVERPLKAILEVRRAPFTRLRKLSPEQAFGVLIRQSFIPMWDTDTAALAMANVRRLSRTTPVYRLFCGPEVDDARAVHRILFEHPEEIEEELPEMKVREGFVLRTVVDEHMVMPTGANIGKFGGAVVLNDVSAFIWKQLEKPISREDLLAQILGEFDVDEATASRDLDALLDQLREMELLEE